ncbi:DNA cytosine methyltransferase [Salmonella enterica]|uniref:DNA cytosine methyltransferase n=1 Tax=Salmonella enterica subsp. enterica serovar Lattenkamp TaxID=2564671 RepID=A0A5W2M2B4_SALET|nr:DNA cytosine methyltransferase [Salmonella enterica]EAA3557139.1 DNA cytosine methyltransferase [Salmonella enterica subsp. enterica serovar Montevideo]EAA3607345.1 DNA cytosine methyltransferase [Salmonella enterica subsp. enterica serovar Senftenberg]EAA3840126.1 DNA cytosine methyltransferase [Salmonella enterica subsp. houtenae]EAA4004303.1 DNA cytosine methyltransferase [Salmonella enterica subsp. enterica serovar Ealing]EAB8210172.1 DNA cytosine methyltransferase [Salmonella enterica 
MNAYYNEFEKYPSAWLNNLITGGLIAAGNVDERSITDVLPEDVIDKTQCHWFAGIGVWSYALRLAGWPDSRPVWTASLPCQPWSSAGKGGKFEDERHLWPVFFRLVKECRPPVIFGEQVSSKDGLEWFATVQADLENAGYAVAAFDTCAAGVGAPHIRQRLYWMAYLPGESSRAGLCNTKSAGVRRYQPCNSSSISGMEHSGSQRQQRWIHRRKNKEWEAVNRSTGCHITTGGLACNDDKQRPYSFVTGGPGNLQGEWNEDAEASSGYSRALWSMPFDLFWRDADWLFCQDGKWRPVEPESFPLADGIANRVGKLRAYGNAIVAPLAAAFIASAMEAIHDFENSR